MYSPIFTHHVWFSLLLTCSPLRHAPIPRSAIRRHCSLGAWHGGAYQYLLRRISEAPRLKPNIDTKSESASRRAIPWTRYTLGTPNCMVKNKWWRTVCSSTRLLPRNMVNLKSRGGVVKLKSGNSRTRAFSPVHMGPCEARCCFPAAVRPLEAFEFQYNCRFH